MVVTVSVMRSVTVFVSVWVSVIVIKPDGVTGFTVRIPWSSLEVEVADVEVDVTWAITTGAVSLKDGNDEDTVDGTDVVE